MAGSRREDREFLSAPAADEIRRADFLADRRRQFFEGGVSEEMAVPVVDLLEVVEIHHEHAHGFPGMLTPVEFPLRLTFESPAIRELGEFVVLAEFLEAFLRFFEFRDVLKDGHEGDDFFGIIHEGNRANPEHDFLAVFVADDHVICRSFFPFAKCFGKRKVVRRIGVAVEGESMSRSRPGQEIGFLGNAFTQQIFAFLVHEHDVARRDLEDAESGGKDFQERGQPLFPREARQESGRVSGSVVGALTHGHILSLHIANFTLHISILVYSWKNVGVDRFAICNPQYAICNVLWHSGQIVMDLAVFLGGVVAGSVIAWLVIAPRLKAATFMQVSEASARAQVAEKQLEEVRREKEQIREEAHRDFAGLRKELEQEQQARVKAEIQWQETSKGLEEQKRLLEEAKQRLMDAFKALSAEALDANNKKFLTEAEQRLKMVMQEAQGDLGKREEAIQGVVRPLQDVLKRYEEQVRGMEERRQTAYGSLDQQLKDLASAVPLLQKETGNLANALKDSRVRGRWGELALRRAAEVAGMIHHCDFDEQTSGETEEGRQRPDMTVHLPRGRDIVVDAKAPMEAYQEAVTTADAQIREQAFKRHALHVRNHVNTLASKAYWNDKKDRVDFVVMFMPGESLFSAALEADPTLLEEAMEKRVILASPTTLVALLRAVEIGWRQELMAQNAEKISDLAKELYERIAKFTDHLRKMGSALGQATGAYNSAIGSFEGRVLPSARKFKELGVPASEEIPVMSAVEHEPRILVSPTEVEG